MLNRHLHRAGGAIGYFKSGIQTTLSLNKSCEASFAFSAAGHHRIEFPMPKCFATSDFLWTFRNRSPNGKFSSLFGWFQPFPFLPEDTGRHPWELSLVDPSVDRFEADSSYCFGICNLFGRPRFTQPLLDAVCQPFIPFSLWARLRSSLLVILLCGFGFVFHCGDISPDFSVDAGSMPP